MKEGFPWEPVAWISAALVLIVGWVRYLLWVGNSGALLAEPYTVDPVIWRAYVESQKPTVERVIMVITVSLKWWLHC